MKKIHVTDIAHQIILNEVNKQSIIVDATCGNGHDTLFLAQHVKHVHAFDIQKAAIDQSKASTKDYPNITYHQKSHTTITKAVDDYDGVIFNLGYLPGKSHLVTTTYLTTIEALELLHKNKKGFILVVGYPGHIEGLKEVVAIQSFLDKHTIKYQVIKLPYETKNEAPFIFFWKY